MAPLSQSPLSKRSRQVNNTGACPQSATTTNGSGCHHNSLLRSARFKTAATFGDCMFRFYVRNTKDSNCVLSPANVCKCVAMSQHDAKGETKVEMDHALGTAPQVSGSGAYDVMKLLKESCDAEFTLTSANISSYRPVLNRRLSLYLTCKSLFFSSNVDFKFLIG